MANTSPWKRSYIKPLSGDCKTCFAQGLTREGRGEGRKETALTKISTEGTKKEEHQGHHLASTRFGVPNKRSCFSK